MLAPVFFSLATFSSSARISQDLDSLYIAQQNAIVRVSKDDPAQRLALTPPMPHRVAAIDVIGAEVFFGTAATPACGDPLACSFGPCHIDCPLTDTNTVHFIAAVPLSGGDPRIVAFNLPGVTEIAHDDGWIYWLEPSSETNEKPSADARLRRVDRSGLVTQTIATGLSVSYRNPHPFALGADDVYVSSGGRLLRFPKSGGAATDLGAEPADSAIGSDGEWIYVPASARTLTQFDAHTGTATPLRPSIYVENSTWFDSILAGHDGVVVLQEESGWEHTAWRGWVASDLCSGTATLLKQVTGNDLTLYFIDPLSAPDVAIDDRGVYVEDRRVITFGSRCDHRRAGRR